MEPSKAPAIFLKPYNPTEQEPKILKKWEKSGYANPDRCIEDGITAPDAEPFSIVLPPPNVTGILHMGHAAMLAVEDILVRYHRMQGFKTLWVPGTDSAAIATQSKVEDIIYKSEKKTRHDIGREELILRIEKFTDESKATIINQVKRMGASLDWSRYAYTMDEQRNRAVNEAFVRMYDAGLIYRGDRIVNWDPKLQTTVSDDEIEYVEQKDPFYHFQYGPFVIGTVRPETKFGDKYVVVHPDDARYEGFKHGQQIELEWINGPITATVIKDEAADMELGSGAMTITPSHSAIDFEIAQRHELDVERVIDDRGILLNIAGEFKGQHIKKARAMIVEKLQKKGLIVKVDENYVHNVATNSRGGGIIEPQIKRQWFIAVNEVVKFPTGEKMTLKQWMHRTVESGSIDIMPERFEKIYYHWIDNLRDWNISRQIWFGHRIPVWYCSASKDAKTTPECLDPKIGPIVSRETVSSCPRCGGQVEQDPDVLDTWFSSGLWTFSTLGWPEQTQDLQTYHPTTVLETGYDILFFWVARMILMSGFLVGDAPFKKVYLHGLVRDEKGRKMSKSLGNIIDPLTMIEKYGADATRLSLIVGASMGNDMKLSEDRVRGYKNFANKIWNIARFVLENTVDVDFDAEYSENDKRIRDYFDQIVIKEVTKNIEGFRLDWAADNIYHYFWDRFAAMIIEHSKTIFAGESPDEDGPEFIASRKKLLYLILVDSIKLLHPFMPFVTEAIWQELPKKSARPDDTGRSGGDSDLLMVARWPSE